jgi:hypothetical protein
MKQAIVRLVFATIMAAGMATVAVWACGPHFSALQTVAALSPADPEQFERGNVGIVRPNMRRAHLAVAYRALAGVPPMTFLTEPHRGPSSQDAAVGWRIRRDSILGKDTQHSGREQRLIDYMSPPNCLTDGYETAAWSFDAHAKRFGERSAELRDWTLAQDTVFANCEETPLVVPPPAPAGSNPLLKADRDYQIAAAYFYGMRYDEAAQRFRAIADDVASRWRPYANYLAARSTIRSASHGHGGSYADAERQLLEVIADPVAAPVHESARGLLTLVRIRFRPADQLRVLSTRLAGATEPIEHSELSDFTYLMDRAASDAVSYDYGLIDVNARDAHDMVDWMMAMQGEGAAARDRAVQRWRDTNTQPWLVAALWHATSDDAASPALLTAAAAVPPSSASYPTVTFLRLRLLLARDAADEARDLLEGLPDEPRDGFNTEAINVLRAMRTALARSLDEFLRHAPRVSGLDFGSTGALTFDEDTAVVLNDRAPLERLIEASLSSMLPPQLRVRVAIAAFTRALLLDRHDEALRVAPVLRELALFISADLDRYSAAATPGERRRAATLLLVRTPGMTTQIHGLQHEDDLVRVEPRRHAMDYTQAWWCPRYSEPSRLVRLIYRDREVPTPPFLVAAERQTAAREAAALATTGSPARYLATAALEFARETPSDPDAPELLSRIVTEWRRTCRDERDAVLAQSAFRELHRRFPKSEWAKRTKYWYR